MRTFLIAFLANSLFAATPIQIWSSSDLKSSATVAGKSLGAFGSHSLSLWRREKSGEAELHKVKTDLLIVEAGSATLVTGGTIPDAHQIQPNEVRGSSIQGGESKKVAPGDVIHIPAGTPHQFLLEPGQTVSYLALKITR